MDIPHALLAVLAMVSAGEAGQAAGDQVTRAPVAASALADDGPYRFSEQSWLAAVERCADKTNAAASHPRIFQTSGGRYYVPVERERRNILAQRRDAVTARGIAACVAWQNRSLLEMALKRPPSTGELYAAHLAGSGPAIKLIELAGTRGAARAAEAGAEFESIVRALASNTAKQASVALVHKHVIEAADRKAEPVVREMAALHASAEAAKLKGDMAEGVMSVGQPLASTNAHAGTRTTAAMAVP